MNQPKVNILILNWNGGKYLFECIKSLKKIKYSNFKITVIDNKSTDNSLSNIDSNDVEIIKHSKNHKYAKGYNKAIFNLKNDDSKFYMIINNDTYCDSNIISSFIRGVEEFGEHNIFGAKIYYHHNKNTIWYAGGNLGLPNFLVSHKGIRNIDSEKFNKNYQTSYVTGCCIFISKLKFLEIEGFNESFGMYGEDVDFCIRARKYGAKCYYIHEAKLWHHVSFSYGGNNSIIKNLNKLKSILKLIYLHPLEIIIGKK